MNRGQRGIRKRAGAFSLLEVLVALGILGLALVFVTQILVAEAVVERRSRTNEAALQILEAHVESIRGGWGGPWNTGTDELEILVSPAPGTNLSDLRLTKSVRALSPPGLYAVDLRLEFRHGDRRVTRRVVMRLWRP